MSLHQALSVSPYPNSALSAGQFAAIAAVVLLALAAWLILVFAADRQPRHPAAAGTASPPQRRPDTREDDREQHQREAA